MCTENYYLADYDKRLENSAFNNEPINLKACQIKNKVELDQTKNREVEALYFLTLWSLNKEGGMTRKFESDGFTMCKNFKNHFNSTMELKISDDENLIYIT
jgi:hypothetical protein